MTCRKTDGENVANATAGLGLLGKYYLAGTVNRLVRKRMAEAWEEGYAARRDWNFENPYDGSKKK